MNASEKRICATPELMQLDQQMGEIGRRAALNQDNFNSDQRRFRKALKTCKGDEACLTISYQNRIAELQAFVNTLTPPTDDEAAKLAAEADKAQEKREAQADTREAIAASVEQADESAALAAADAALPTVTMEPPQHEVAEQLVDAPGEAVEQPSAEVAKDDKAGWGTLAIVLLFIGGVIVAFFDWLFKAVKRCPRCTKWWAGKIYDQDHESHIEHETKEFVDEHRNRNNVLVGTTRVKRQVAVQVSNTTNYLRCQICQHEWVINHSSRSS
jgi:uncharacterized protein